MPLIPGPHASIPDLFGQPLVPSLTDTYKNVNRAVQNTFGSSQFNAMPLIPPLRFNVFTLLLLSCCSPISCIPIKWKKCSSLNKCGEFCLSYPFGKRDSGCGDPDFQLDCDPSGTPLLNISGNEYHILEPCVLDKNSLNLTIAIAHDNLWSANKCKVLDNYTQSWWYGHKYFQMVHGYTNLTFWRDCDKNEMSQKDHKGKIPKLSLCGNIWYYSLSSEDFKRTLLCKTHLQLPIKEELLRSNHSINETFLGQGFEIQWHVDPYRYHNCAACLLSDGSCGFNKSNQFLCYCLDGTSHPEKCHGGGGGGGSQNKIAIIIGCFIGGALLAAAAIAAVLFTYHARAHKRRKSHPYSISKVEKFLEEYAYEMPTRFSFDELKRMTNNFAEKLGEGGFGVVYKGKLLNSTLVAVKLLDRNRHSESQFMNEVATIGRIHHVNLVRLMGYCFENLTSALVYEYMANGSLEKFIFEGKKEEQVLGFKQLYLIALGAARGIAYLHEDCQQRIIHFDIKPHNILLDADFTPKVSDFRLAKLCGKGDDHISMTVARGTPGYAAPEVFNRDLGLLSDKSDVYSFGMLLLEIVAGRKKFDGNLSHSSQFYFPQWAFKMLDMGELGTRLREGKMETEDAEKARSLIKVGLWCIQYNYIDRPCMSKVVQMIEGNGDDVANPPSAFKFSSSAPETPSLSLLSSIEESRSIRL